MQFWSVTPFMPTTDAVAIARMLDECGYDGVICGRDGIGDLRRSSADLYRRAEDLGITAVMCAPWLGEGVEPSDRAGRRAAIERFAETVIERCR
jgi:protein tyrosine phosphatase (PTP) superfamily phosphohydrolase (DUF442 family)